MGEQLAAVGGGQLGLRGRLAAAAVEDVRLAEERRRSVSDRPGVRACGWRVPDRVGVGRREAEWQRHLADRGRRPAKCVRRRQACVGTLGRSRVLLARVAGEAARPSPSSIGPIRIVTAIGGGGTSPATIASMYSMPLIVAPAAAVGTGSCQTRVRLRLVSGLVSANSRAASTAVPPLRAATLAAGPSVELPPSLTGVPRGQPHWRPCGAGGWPDSAGRRRSPPG